MKAKISTEGKTLEERMALAEEISSNYFRQGLNCAEAVVRTFLDLHDTGDLPDSVIRMASGFGGGIGRTRNTCGAITGAVLALSIVRGRDPFEKKGAPERAKQLREEVYPVFSEMITEIEEKYGTLICRELSAPQGDFEGKARKRSCLDIIAYCAALTEKYADKSE